MRIARWRGPLIAATLLLIWLAFGQGLVNRVGLRLLQLDGPPPGLELEGQLYYTQGFNGLWRHDLSTGVNQRWWLPEMGSLVSGVAAAPDGRQLALAWAMPGTGGFQPGTTDLWLTSIPKIEPRPLLTRADSLESWRDPFWSPDGRWLLVTHQQTLRDAAGEAQSIRMTVERVALDGSRQVLLEAAEQAALSADGAQLTYLRVEPESWSQSLMLARSDGSDARELVPATVFRSLASPRFTPDGSALVFSASGTRQDQDALVQQGAGVVLAHGDPWHIWQLTLADGELTRLTDVPLDGPALAWSPGGEALAVLAAEGLYLRARERMWRLATVSAEGGLSWAPALSAVGS